MEGGRHLVFFVGDMLFHTKYVLFITLSLRKAKVSVEKDIVAPYS